MKWKKFRIRTVTEAEDIIISTLYDIGLEGAQIEDKVPLTAAEKEQMFVDILPDVADDGIAYLNFYLEEDEDKEAVLSRVREELAELSGVSRKTMERHRTYLVAILLAYTNGYEIIRGHLCQISPGKEGTV